MKKVLYPLLAATILATSGCKKYNDSALWQSVNNLDKRVAALEEQCKQLNSNIISIQTIINISQEGDYITSIKPIIEGGKEIGYIITFSKSQAITIYHGDNGETPNIGIAKDADGHYYWTLDGEWLLDNDNNKVSAEGHAGMNGQDGVSPSFKIENEVWYISLNGGDTWVYIGNDSGSSDTDDNSLFKAIDTSNPDYVVFTLADGSEFKISRHAELSICFDEDALITMRPNSTRQIEYTVSGVIDNLQLEVLSSGNVRAKISDTNSATGIIIVSTGNTIDEYDKVVVLASNGKTTIMNSLSFEEAGVRVTGELSYNIPMEGQLIQINFETNTEYSLSVPQDAQDWIKSASPSRAWSKETISLQIEPNEDSDRKATIAIVDKEGIPFQNILINQEGSTIVPSDLEYAFPDPKFRAYILENFDTDKNGKINNQEALNVTTINTNYVGNVVGIEYFPNLTSLTANLCDMASLDLSKSPQLIEVKCKWGKLSSINLSNSTELRTLDCYRNKLTTLDLSKCKKLTYLDLGENQLTSLDVSNNTELDFLACYDNQLTSLDVSKNTKLKTLGCHTNYISSINLSNNKELELLYCMINKLVKLDLSNNPKLKELAFHENQIRSIDLSNLQDLVELRCHSNFLTGLDITSNSKLKSLDCSNNSISELDVRSNLDLTYLYCSNNNLTELDLSRNTNLEQLHAHYNKLSTLNLSKTRINEGEAPALILSPMPTLKTLYLNADWEDDGIITTYYDDSEWVPNVPEETEVIYIH